MAGSWVGNSQNILESRTACCDHSIVCFACDPSRFSRTCPLLRPQYFASKSLFRSILHVTPTGSRFCGQSFSLAHCFQDFAWREGEGGTRLPVASSQWSVVSKNKCPA